MKFRLLAIVNIFIMMIYVHQATAFKAVGGKVPSNLNKITKMVKNDLHIGSKGLYHVYEIKHDKYTFITSKQIDQSVTYNFMMENRKDATIRAVKELSKQGQTFEAVEKKVDALAKKYDRYYKQGIAICGRTVPSICLKNNEIRQTCRCETAVYVSYSKNNRYKWNEDELKEIDAANLARAAACMVTNC
ncbi:hypothetical protein BJ944DRAFT_250365 [Cunninghamella echinulata]|nr:hypothetical protein BJ944DRAFT_250365 [Cunninghamella echinulata]